jgi:hypothetical protein
MSAFGGKTDIVWTQQKGCFCLKSDIAGLGGVLAPDHWRRNGQAQQPSYKTSKTFLERSSMKHPSRADFDTLVTDQSVIVTFAQTNSRYRFHRLTNPTNIARVGPVSFAGVQHAQRGTGDYSSDEVQNMAQHIAGEFALSFRSPLEDALAAVRGERVHNVTPPRLVSLASVPWRISSEITATLCLIQKQDASD